MHCCLRQDETTNHAFLTQHLWGYKGLYGDNHSCTGPCQAAASRIRVCWEAIIGLQADEQAHSCRTAPRVGLAGLNLSLTALVQGKENRPRNGKPQASKPADKKQTMEAHHWVETGGPALSLYLTLEAAHLAPWACMRHMQWALT